MDSNFTSNLLFPISYQSLSGRFFSNHIDLHHDSQQQFSVLLRICSSPHCSPISSIACIRKHPYLFYASRMLAHAWDACIYHDDLSSVSGLFQIHLSWAILTFSIVALLPLCEFITTSTIQQFLRHPTSQLCM
jgi:hypothetical protein